MVFGAISGAVGGFITGYAISGSIKGPAMGAGVGFFTGAVAGVVTPLFIRTSGCRSRWIRVAESIWAGHRRDSTGHSERIQNTGGGFEEEASRRCNGVILHDNFPPLIVDGCIMRAASMCCHF